MGATAGAVWGTRMSGNAGIAPASSWEGLAAVPIAGLIGSLAARAIGVVGAGVSALTPVGAIVAPRRRGAPVEPSDDIAAAVESERRRIARDIHDGLAQDLAFIAARARLLERDPTAPVRFDHLASAATRALEDSRTAIATLTRPLDESLDAALARNAIEVAERHGGEAELRLQAGVAVSPGTRQSLVRIVREAVSNAMRHGGADHVRVSLSRDRMLRLDIVDDGCGFDVAGRAADPDTGFGLLSMEERARALGGDLAIRSEPGAGTTIELALPCPAA